MSDNKFKLVVIGGRNTGKQTLVNKISRSSKAVTPGPHLQATEHMVKIQLQAANKDIMLNVWVLPGDQNLVALNRIYIRDANAALIVYDVMNKDSLEYTETLVRELEEFAPSECILSMVGNKMDSKGAHAVSRD